MFVQLGRSLSPDHRTETPSTTSSFGRKANFRPNQRHPQPLAVRLWALENDLVAWTIGGEEAMLSDVRSAGTSETSLEAARAARGCLFPPFPCWQRTSLSPDHRTETPSTTSSFGRKANFRPNQRHHGCWRYGFLNKSGCPVVGRGRVLGGGTYFPDAWVMAIRARCASALAFASALTGPADGQARP
jgi:hypothetical protein